jgi:uncharacterized membrane-anchored protein YitT (DUF2179 family)
MQDDTERTGISQMAVSLGFDLAGGALLAVGITAFTAPNRIAPGGVTAIATLINYLTGLPIGTLSLAINIPLLAVGYRFLGRSFTLRTLRTLAVFTVLIDVALRDIPVYRGDPLLAAIFGGVLMGLGLGVVFMRGSTTGGSDIVLRLVQRRYPHLALGSIMLVLDMMILLVAAAVYRDIETALYGLIAIFVSAKLIDSIIYGLDVGRCAIIVSAHAEEIGRQINNTLERGATLLPAKGIYTGNETGALLCVVRRQEFIRLKTIVRRVDPRAFVIVTEAGEIFGEGFKPIHRDL